MSSNDEHSAHFSACDLKNEDCGCSDASCFEHGNLSAPISYLFDISKSIDEYQQTAEKTHFRCFRVGGVTIRVESDLIIREDTFHPKFEKFKISGKNNIDITIHHHFHMPDFNGADFGELKYCKPPWAIYKKGESWIYKAISPGQQPDDLPSDQITFFNLNYSHVRIFNGFTMKDTFQKGNIPSLALFPTDQILLAPFLVQKDAFIIHAGGVDYSGNGLLFVGHSGAGKSTSVSMMKDKSTILCDDRIIIRKWPEDIKIHGTWNHGDISDISPESAPLRAVFFLEQSDRNNLRRIKSKFEIVKRMAACSVRGHETGEWWKALLSLIEDVADNVPCYQMDFDKSGCVLNRIESLFQSGQEGYAG